MATNKVPSLCKQPDCIKLIFWYGEEYITDLTISTDLTEDHLVSDKLMRPVGPKLIEFRRDLMKRDHQKP